MTANCFLYALDLRDDQSPVFETDPSSPKLSIEIKDIPFSVRRTTLKIAQDTASVDDILLCNYIKLTNSGSAFKARWYKITDIRQISVTASAAELEIVFDAFATASYIAMRNSSKFKLKASFTTTPTGVTRQPFNPVPTFMKKSDTTVKFFKHIAPITIGLIDFPVILVLISGMYKKLNAASASIGTFGFWYCPSDPTMTFTDSGGGIIHQADDVLADISTYTPITNIDDVIDVSFTTRMPCQYNQSSDTQFTQGKWINDGTGWYMQGVQYAEYPAASGKRFLYVNQDELSCSQNYYDGLIHLSEKQIHTCQLEVRDIYGNNVGTIDTRNADADGDVKFRLYTIAGPTKVTNRMVLPDGTAIDWSEGKLPYLCDAYTKYLQTEAQYDREMLQINIDKNNIETAQKIADSIESGAVGALTSFGASLITSGYKALIARDLEQPFNQDIAIRELEAKKGKVRQAASSLYQPSYDAAVLNGYFSSDGTVSMKRDAIIVIEPEISASQFTEYTSNWGYPSGDYIYTLIRSSGTDNNMPTSGAFRTSDIVDVSLNDALGNTDNDLWNKSVFNRWLTDQCKSLIRFKKL